MQITPVRLERIERFVAEELSEVTKDVYIKVNRMGGIINGKSLPDGREATAEEKKQLHDIQQRALVELAALHSKRVSQLADKLEKAPEPVVDELPPEERPKAQEKEVERLLGVAIPESEAEQLVFYPLFPVILGTSYLMKGLNLGLEHGVVPAAKAVGNTLEKVYDTLKFW